MQTIMSVPPPYQQQQSVNMQPTFVNTVIPVPVPQAVSIVSIPQQPQANNTLSNNTDQKVEIIPNPEEFQLTIILPTEEDKTSNGTPTAKVEIGKDLTPQESSTVQKNDDPSVEVTKAISKGSRNTVDEIIITAMQNVIKAKCNVSVVLKKKKKVANNKVVPIDDSTPKSDSDETEKRKSRTIPKDNGVAVNELYPFDELLIVKAPQCLPRRLRTREVFSLIDADDSSTVFYLVKEIDSIFHCLFGMYAPFTAKLIQLDSSMSSSDILKMSADDFANKTKVLLSYDRPCRLCVFPLKCFGKQQINLKKPNNESLGTSSASTVSAKFCA